MYNGPLDELSISVASFTKLYEGVDWFYLSFEDKLKKRTKLCQYGYLSKALGKLSIIFLFVFLFLFCVDCATISGRYELH